jgi:predicted dehydrogenase
VRVRVALVGCGSWGRNLLRILTESPKAELVAVADPSAMRRRDAHALAPTAAVFHSLGDALEVGVDAVLLAAPPYLHATLVLEALASGADVFVEKPLATRVADAERCAARAEALGRVAMVGHLLRYHPAVEALLALTSRGALGRIVRVEATRLSVTGDRATTALWSLGPHDVSLLHAIDRSPLQAVSATSAPTGDPVVIDAELASGLSAHITLSRVGAVKERRLRVVGTAGTASFDDVHAPDRISVNGDDLVVPWSEPLAREIDHFLDCVTTRAEPRTTLAEAVTITRLLARFEDALAASAEAPPKRTASLAR